MPYFLTRPDLYALFQRELPADVYPFGPPTGSYSGASIDAKAAVCASAYFNLSRIYDNYFPFFADESIEDWYITAYGSPAAANADLDHQRQAVVAKLRSRSGFSIPEMISVVQQIVGTSTPVEIAELGCETGSWILDYSELGVETYLGLSDVPRESVFGPDLCSKGPSDFGLSQAQWDDLRYQAYTYQVRIYGYTLTADQAARLETLLLKEEPARSNHFVTDGLPLDQMLNGTD